VGKIETSLSATPISLLLSQTALKRHDRELGPELKGRIGF